ncbi:MAG: LPP20 family lipoprotein [Nitrospira sp.]|nr:LPP20 family lipoprotein [Nitrospira sp.]
MLSVLCLCGVIGIGGCAWLGGKNKPEWVDGRASDYPSSQYLTGVGQGENRSTAENQAYAAVARIFKAEVAAQAKDWEAYLVTEHQEVASAERRLTIDHVTKVSTDKVLESVSIGDAWYDARMRVHYALAVVSRSQAEASVTDKIVMLDREIEADVGEARQTTDKLAKVRALRQAGRNLVLREAYNTDLRVIRSSGQGVASGYRVGELSSELTHFLSSNLGVVLQIAGDQAEPIQRALAQGLVREGFHVTADSGGGDAESSELLVRGMTRLFPIEVQDPNFRYIRWCSDLEIVERATQRVVGAIARGGKEGHLTEREATAKTLRVIQQEFSTEVAPLITAHIFGEATLPATAAMPAGCPREASAGKR